MSTKGFTILVTAILILGGIIGGAFVGGMAIGESRAEKSTDGSSSFQFPSNLQGQLNQDQLDQMRQRFQGTRVPGGTPGGQIFAGRGGLSGTITRVAGDTVTVNTPQGPLEVTITSGTTIQKTTTCTVADLQEGVGVTVVGQRSADGVTEAASIVIVPEGTGSPFGGGFPNMQP